MSTASPSPSARLEAVMEKQDVVVRVHGRATCVLAPDLKQFGARAAQTGTTRMLMDMGDCENMDSTFIGVLCGLAGRFRKLGGRLVLLELSEKNLEILRTLGVHRLLECHVAGAGPQDLTALLRRQTVYCPIARADLDPRGQNATMLEAHDDLVRSNPENLMKFKDVIDLLRHDPGAAGD